MPRLTEPQLAESSPSTGPQRRVVFDHTVEGLFLIALKGRLSRLAVAALQREGLDLSKKLLPAYSFEVWRRCLAIAVGDLYPLVSRAEGYRRLGHEIVEGVGRTAMGRAMIGVGRLLGPLRVLRRLDHNLHSADNYVRSRLTELTPHWCEVWINEVMDQPSYYQGILEAYLGLAGALEIRVELLSREGEGATYRLQWAD